MGMLRADRQILMMEDTRTRTPSSIMDSGFREPFQPAYTGRLITPALADVLARLAGQADRLADPAAALREGYVRLGPDFPGMGAHWIHAERVLSGGLDPEQPPVLVYATVQGETKLVGAAFTHFLDPAEDPPPFFGIAGIWKGHHARLDEESLFLTHQPLERPDLRWLSRIALIRTWLLENPSGVTARNNWRLPFLRLGLERPDGTPAAASRALSLLGGEGYYAELFDFTAWLDPRERALVAEALVAHAFRVAEWVGRARTDSSTAVGELAGIWRSLWCTLQRGLDPQSWSLLAAIEKA
jgi:hypothetical protein